MKNLIVLRGGMGKKRREAIRNKIAEIPDNEERVFIATGKLIGEGFDDARLFEDMTVIDSFDDSVKALKRYSVLHQYEPHREYCFFHTSRPEIVANERYVGVRGPR